MRRTILYLLSFLVPITAAMAGRQSSADAVTLAVSCAVCQADEPIIYSGGGYKSKSSVQLDVVGPTSFSIFVKIDADGFFEANFGTALPYQSGDYTVSVSGISGHTLIPLKEISFTVQ